MSVSSEVRRTLVKSPPELWAELSDPAALGRHLGELGEIRIVKIEPERTVDWEAAAADGAEVSGRVKIEPSGWGTRVTLSASRGVVEPEPATEPEQATEPIPEGSGSDAEAATIQTVETEQTPESEALEVIPEVEPEPEPEIAQLEPRPGFFARLFRRRKQQPAPEAVAEPEPIADPEPDPEPVAIVEVEEPTPDEIVSETDISAGHTAPRAGSAELEQQTEAVLTGVLDRLGAAHHRPFSRS